MEWHQPEPGLRRATEGLRPGRRPPDDRPEAGRYGFSRTPGYGTGKQWGQQAFYFTDDDKKPANPNGGGIRPGRGKPLPVEPEPKPKDPEPKDPKDPKKEEPKKDEKPKLSQEDRRKVAFKQWDEWYAKNKDEKKDDKKDPKADPKGEPKKEEPKKDLPGTTTPVAPPPLPGGGGAPDVIREKR